MSSSESSSSDTSSSDSSFHDGFARSNAPQYMGRRSSGVDDPRDMPGPSGIASQRSQQNAAVPQKTARNRLRRRPTTETEDLYLRPEDSQLSDWFTQDMPQKRYFPQIGDDVMYFPQGHEIYLSIVKEKYQRYYYPQVVAPWCKFILLSQEHCRVIHVEFVMIPSRMCKIQLRLLRDHLPGDGIFTIYYHPISEAMDFLVLKDQFDRSKLCRFSCWRVGQRFRCAMPNNTWRKGVITAIEPLDQRQPQSRFQRYRVRWDDDTVGRLSGWDLEFINHESRIAPRNASIEICREEIDAWQRVLRRGCGEWPLGSRERFLKAIAPELELLLDHLLCEPLVDAFHERTNPIYLSVIAYPVDLGLILLRLDSGFYRRMSSLRFDLFHFLRNATEFYPPTHDCAKVAKLCTELLLRIIRDGSINVSLRVRYRRSFGGAPYSDTDSEEERRKAPKRLKPSTNSENQPPVLIEISNNEVRNNTERRVPSVESPPNEMGNAEVFVISDVGQPDDFSRPDLRLPLRQPLTINVEVNSNKKNKVGTTLVNSSAVNKFATHNRPQKGGKENIRPVAVIRPFKPDGERQSTESSRLQNNRNNNRLLAPRSQEQNISNSSRTQAPRPQGQNNGNSSRQQIPRSQEQNISNSSRTQAPRPQGQNNGNSSRQQIPRSQEQNISNSSRTQASRPQGQNNGNSSRQQIPRSQEQNNSNSNRSPAPRPQVQINRDSNRTSAPRSQAQNNNNSNRPRSPRPRQDNSRVDSPRAVTGSIDNVRSQPSTSREDSDIQIAGVKKRPPPFYTTNFTIPVLPEFDRSPAQQRALRKRLARHRSFFKELNTSGNECQHLEGIPSSSQVNIIGNNESSIVKSQESACTLQLVEIDKNQTDQSTSQSHEQEVTSALDLQNQTLVLPKPFPDSKSPGDSDELTVSLVQEHKCESLCNFSQLTPPTSQRPESVATSSIESEIDQSSSSRSKEQDPSLPLVSGPDQPTISQSRQDREDTDSLSLAIDGNQPSTSRSPNVNEDMEHDRATSDCSQQVRSSADHTSSLRRSCGKRPKQSYSPSSTTTSSSDPDSPVIFTCKGTPKRARTNKITKMREWRADCIRVLETLWEDPDAAMFREAEMHRYRRSVIEWISLEYIMSNLKCGMVEDPHQFVDQVNTMLLHGRSLTFVERRNMPRINRINRKIDNLSLLFDALIDPVIRKWKRSQAKRKEAKNENVVNEEDFEEETDSNLTIDEETSPSSA